MSRVLASLHNLSLAQLADHYGSIVAEIRGLELRRDAIKAALLDRATDAEINGDLFKVAISTTKRAFLDIDAIREKLGPAWCERHSKFSAVTSLRALPIAAPAIPLAA